MTVLTTILSIVGIITLLAIAYFFWRRHLHASRQREKQKMRFPPEQYMRHVGVFCPDYWIHTGSGICENKFAIPVANKQNPVCFDSGSTTRKTFNNLPEFPVKKGDERLKSRCDWIDNCGTSTGAKGLWSGISDLCGGM